MVSWMWPLMRVMTCPSPNGGYKSKDHCRKEAALQLRTKPLLQLLFPGKLSTLYTTTEI